MRHRLALDADKSPEPLDDLDLPGGEHVVVSVGTDYADNRAVLSILTVANA